jgi:hypothetical protein
MFAWSRNATGYEFSEFYSMKEENKDYPYGNA